MNGLCFSKALTYMKQGYAAKRSSWINKSVYIVNGNYAIDLPIRNRLDFLDIKLFDKGDYGTVTSTPHFRVSEDNKNTEGWNPSQEDILSEDWTVFK